MISFDEALQQTLTHISSLGTEVVDLSRAVDRIVADDLVARVDSPSVNVSYKDGYAVQSADIRVADPETPTRLRLIGTISAGGDWDGVVTAGTAVRILSGAPIPAGAQAVVADEFASDDGQFVTVINHAEPGRNILAQGSDVAVGQPLVKAGSMLRPTIVGLLAAAGYAQVSVVKQPHVAIIATGDEVVAPGQPLGDGKLYASNLVTLAAWCSHYGLDVTTRVVKDEPTIIRENLLDCLTNHDAIITSGGAWKGDRDLVVHLLDELGWQKIFHRVRMGPGKAVGLGLYDDKPVFCLPGGPPSNHMAFLQLALPGLQTLGGYQSPGLPTLRAQLTAAVSGQNDWTQFIHGLLVFQEDTLCFQPLKPKNRLQMMAQTEGIIRIPVGIDLIPEGKMVQVQVLSWPGHRENILDNIP